jgi:hypothetical protein
MEQLLRNLPESEHGPIIGVTIIAGGRQQETEPQGEEHVPYELVESGENVYITATIPTEIRSAPYVDIQSAQVKLVMDDQVTAVDLPVPIDVQHSFYQVRHGVIDVICHKKPVESAETVI